MLRVVVMLCLRVRGCVGVLCVRAVLFFFPVENFTEFIFVRF